MNRNSPPNSRPVNEHPSEPAPACGSPASYDDALESLALASTEAPSRRRTLKHRIKRNMLNDSINSSATSIASAPGGFDPAMLTSPVREPASAPPGDLSQQSVMEAASALASLGVTSPTSSFTGGGGSAPPSTQISPLDALRRQRRQLQPQPSSAPAAANATAAAERRYAMTLSGASSLQGSPYGKNAQAQANQVVDYTRQRDGRAFATALNTGGLTSQYASALASAQPNTMVTNQSLTSAPAGTSSIANRALGTALGASTSASQRALASFPKLYDVLQPTELGQNDRNVDLLSMVRPPPSLAGVQRPQAMDTVRESKGTGVQGSRPFAGLLGSDIPLTFPQKLMEVLSNPEIADVITWLPHGKGFIILQKRKFAINVMPLYFKHSKFTSFTRKLNRWGFTRVSRGPEMGAYYHKYFQRGNYLLCMQMHCQSHNKPVASKDAAAKDEDVAEAPAGPSPPLAVEEVVKPPSVDDELDMERHQMRDSTPGGESNQPSPPPEDLQRALLETRAPGAPHVPRPEGEAPRGGTLARMSPEHLHQLQQQQLQKLQHGHRHHTHRRLHHVHHVRRTDAQPSGFDRAFSRQQQILNEGHQQHQGQARQQQQHQGQAQQAGGSAFKLVQGTGEVNQYHSMQQEQQPSSTAHHAPAQPSASAMQQPPLQRPPQLGTSSLLGVDTTSSRNHPFIIADALKTLKSCSDQALLTALMTKEHEAEGGNKSLDEPQAMDTHQVQSRVHQAMQAQLRRLEEYNRDKKRHRRSTPMGPLAGGVSGGGSNRSEEAGRDEMMEQMKRQHKSNYQRIAGLGGTGSGSGSGGGVLKGGSHHGTKGYSSKGRNPMSQRDVARLAKLYKQRVPKSTTPSSSSGSSGANNPAGTVSDEQQRRINERKNFRAVRRASAA